MAFQKETEQEHRARDEATWGTLGLIGFFFAGSRFWIFLVLLFTVAIWFFNVMGESTMLNSPDIYYGGKDANTGKMVVVKGCRPEQLLPDGGCNKAISLDIVRKAFPFFGEAKQVRDK